MADGEWNAVVLGPAGIHGPGPARLLDHIGPTPTPTVL